MNALETHALELLKKDSLDTAEKAVGPGEAANMLGLLLMQNLAREKEDVFSILGDTHFSMPHEECLRLLARNGFEKVYHETHGENNDAYEIWWHSDGLLLTVESYNRNPVNHLQVYYNWVPSVDLMIAWSMTSSGGFYGDEPERVWVGYYDGREGLFTHLKRLRQHGRFLPVWCKQPFLWFLNYSESRDRDYEYKAINKLKFVALPAHVQTAIGPIG